MSGIIVNVITIKELCMKKDIVYITGHRHPDSDSIISAIAYACLNSAKESVRFHAA